MKNDSKNGLTNFRNIITIFLGIIAIASLLSTAGMSYQKAVRAQQDVIKLEIESCELEHRVREQEILSAAIKVKVDNIYDAVTRIEDKLNQ